MTQSHLPTFHAPLTLSKFYVEFYLSMHLSNTVSLTLIMGVSSKHCLLPLFSLSLIYSTSTHHDPVPFTYISRSIDFVKILCGVLFEHALKQHSVLDLNYVIILPNAGEISTSAEFLVSSFTFLRCKCYVVFIYSQILISCCSSNSLTPFPGYHPLLMMNSEIGKIKTRKTRLLR